MRGLPESPHSAKSYNSPCGWKQGSEVPRVGGLFLLQLHREVAGRQQRSSPLLQPVQLVQGGQPGLQGGLFMEKNKVLFSPRRTSLLGAEHSQWPQWWWWWWWAVLCRMAWSLPGQLPHFPRVWNSSRRALLQEQSGQGVGRQPPLLSCSGSERQGRQSEPGRGERRAGFLCFRFFCKPVVPQICRKILLPGKWI